MDNALKLIPESYKVNGKEFELTDGIESYRVRWEKTPTILTASNKNLINEDMQKMKHLMQYNSKDTLGNLRGKERINENKVFNDVWDKTKKLIKEGDDDKSNMFSRDPKERKDFWSKHYRKKKKEEEVPSEHKFTDEELKKIRDRLDLNERNADDLEAIELPGLTIQKRLKPTKKKFTDEELKKIRDRLDLMEDKKEDKPKKETKVIDILRQLPKDEPLTDKDKGLIAKVIEIMKKINNSDDKIEEVIDKDKGHEAPKDKGDDAGPTSKKPKTRTPIKR